MAELLLTSRERGDMPWPGYGPPERTRKLYGAEIIAIAQGESGKDLLKAMNRNNIMIMSIITANAAIS